MPRLFTGIEIPPGVAQALSMLRGGLPGARWIDPENYHITLRFLGDIDELTANDAASILAEVRKPAFDLRFEGLDAFGGRRPRAVFAAVSAEAALGDLQAEHERLMRRIGLTPETRKFTPHVTLARLRDTSSLDVADYLAARGFFRTAPFPVTRFVLFSSRASTGGGPYVVEEEYPLLSASS
ncbi:MAG: RNA 2',3'-cyclic phosphodiesterase [Proteobacteria bacterium]|nr:RNA 2',3'-cyclic phosphodiesterase [Pseudomonadota bacterium]